MWGGGEVGGLCCCCGCGSVVVFWCVCVCVCVCVCARARACTQKNVFTGDTEKRNIILSPHPTPPPQSDIAREAGLPSISE